MVRAAINMVIMGPSVALTTVKAGKPNMLGSVAKTLAGIPDADYRRDRAGYEANVSFGYSLATIPRPIIEKITPTCTVNDPGFTRSSNPMWCKRFRDRSKPMPTIFAVTPRDGRA